MLIIYILQNIWMVYIVASSANFPKRRDNQLITYFILTTNKGYLITNYGSKI